MVFSFSRLKPDKPVRAIGDLVRKRQRVMTGVQVRIRVHPTGDREIRARMDLKRIKVENRKIPRRYLHLLKHPTDLGDNIFVLPKSRERNVGRRYVVVD